MQEIKTKLLIQLKKTQIDIRRERMITIRQNIVEIGIFGEKRNHYAVYINESLKWYLKFS